MNAIELQRAAERTFGGLWDALGLSPWRELQRTSATLACAQAGEGAAQSDYLRIAASACAEAAAAFARRLSGGEAETIASPTAMLRLWLGELDTAMHAAMLSEPGLSATAASVSAASKRRVAQQRMVEIASDAAGLPTRGQVDAAFREIQQLKREVRRLKRALHGETTA